MIFTFLGSNLKSFDGLKWNSNKRDMTTEIYEEQEVAGGHKNMVGDDNLIVPKHHKSLFVFTEADTGNMSYHISATNSKTIDNTNILAKDSKSDKQSSLAYIPENSWRTPDLEGQVMTEEIAVKFPSGKFVSRNVDNEVWGVGEQITYSIDYGFYRAGIATMSVLGEKMINGGVCYQIQTTARSNDFISKFYKVDDKVTSYIDIMGLFSRRFEKRLREGKYESDRIVDFYHNRLIALNTTKKYLLTEIPLYVQDILSALYYIRTFDFEVGKDEIVNVYADGKVYPLKIIVHKKEDITVPAGTFSCLKIEPILKSEGIFSQKGRLIIWVTDDNLKVPVKMTSKIIIGSIGSNMESYKFGNVE